MSNWTDLLQALAARKPNVQAVPPTLKYEDLWDQQRRIEALEAEVEYLKSVLMATLDKLHDSDKEN